MRSAVLPQSTRDGPTDGIGVAYTRYSMLSRVKTNEYGKTKHDDAVKIDKLSKRLRRRKAHFRLRR